MLQCIKTNHHKVKNHAHRSFFKKEKFKIIQIKNKTSSLERDCPPNSRTMKAKKIYNIECNSKISYILLINPAAFLLLCWHSHPVPKYKTLRYVL